MNTFTGALGDEKSLLALRRINENTRPELWLPSRHVPSGMQASVLGYGVITPSGIPIITRLYAARIPSPKGRPTMVRRNADGRWLATAEKNAKVEYKGRFPASACKPGEVFLKVISTLVKGVQIPIHVFNQWLPDDMTWTHNTEPVNGLVGILPVNQGPCNEFQDRAAHQIHQALYASGFVVSPLYCEKFKQDMPQGFPNFDDAELLEKGPEAYLPALEQWAKDITNSIPVRNPGDLRRTFATFSNTARREVEEIKARYAAPAERPPVPDTDEIPLPSEMTTPVLSPALDEE